MKPTLEAPGAKRLNQKYDEPLSNWAFSFSLRRYTTDLSPPLIGLTDCCFRYPKLEGFALDDLNLGIDMGTRVGIIGRVWYIERTVLRLMHGELRPSR
jgi:ABC-type transport system involved in cytochrome bd biosynthesis fused ATPase/permease subunit